MVEYEQFAKHRRETKESLGEADWIKQIEATVKMLPSHKKDVEK